MGAILCRGYLRTSSNIASASTSASARTQSHLSGEIWHTISARRHPLHAMRAGLFLVPLLAVVASEPSMAIRSLTEITEGGSAVVVSSVSELSAAVMNVSVGLIDVRGEIIFQSGDELKIEPQR